MNEDAVDVLYILKHQPYKENQYLTQAWSLRHGKISLFLPKKFPPRLLYRYIVEWKETKKYAPLDMQIDYIHILSGKNMLASYYVLEWLLTFSPENIDHPKLFQVFMNTLHDLENSQTSDMIEKTLRIYERKSLELLGYGLHVSQISNLHTPYISYHPQEGYSEHSHSSDVNFHVISKAQLTDILTDQYELDDSLKVAKKWIQSIVKQLLPQHEWKCKSLYIKQ